MQTASPGYADANIQTDSNIQNKSNLQEEFVNIILDQLIKRLDKTTNLLKKLPLEDVNESKSRMEKHTKEVEDWQTRWEKAKESANQDQVARYTKFLRDWEQLLKSLSEKLDEQLAAAQAAIQQQDHATDRSEQGTQTDVAIHSELPQTKTTSTKIYAHLIRSGRASMDMIPEPIFKDSDNERVLITINFTERNLTEKEVEQFVSKAGLNVISPSGQSYAFSYEDKIPKAVLTESGAKPKPEERIDKYKQRLAVTMINMIDNVLSKGTVVKVNTKDPFLAKIAQQYIDHLKSETKLEISHSQVTGVAKDALYPDSKMASNIFEDLKPQLSQKNLEAAPWFIEAKQYRHQVKQQLKLKPEPPH